jgi:aromatic ring-cleaving dioxygenase
MSPTDNIADYYHAHIYFDAASRDRACALRELISETFDGVDVGRFHEREVGPHPRWSCQVAFPLSLYSTLVPWLMLNRDGLTIFLHVEAGDVVADHTEHALWMGEMLPLKLEVFNYINDSIHVNGDLYSSNFIIFALAKPGK